MIRLTTILTGLAFACASAGCAAVTNPVADGVPVSHLPKEALGRPKADLRPLPLTLLRQHPPTEYLLDSGDTLAIVANEILGQGDQQPPIHNPDQPGQPAVVGYPVPVGSDGTITLPYLDPIPVRGKSVREVRQILLDTITGKRGGKVFVEPGAAKISVQLLQRRRYQIMVVRGDTPNGGGVGSSGFGGSGVGGGLALGGFGSGSLLSAGKRGLGFNVDLPAYENDVLRALNATGGLPGVDAKNEIVIIRSGKSYCDAAAPEGNTIRIPLYAYPDESLTIREEDVILHEGDVVKIESREAEVFYTGGLLGSGAFPLPRDIDLNVIQAIALVRGPLVNGSFSQTAFVASAVNSGIGNPNASLCTVLRQLPDERQLAIRVDLNKALREPKERIRIQPGDIIILQERPGEAITRYLTSAFRLSGTANVIREADLTATATGTVP